MIIDFLLDIIFPKNCLSCHIEGSCLCSKCFDKLPIAKAYFCYICGKRSPDGRVCQACEKNQVAELTGLLIASDWNNLLIRQIIYECKYRFVRELTKPMADIMIKFLAFNKFFSINNLSGSADEFLLIPVPLHKRRLAWRGFNQAEALARHISKLINIPLANDIIRRSRNTSPQMEIKDKSRRTDNVREAFVIDENVSLRNKIIILIDDVCTTGSTFNECASVIWPKKPREIWGLALARG